MYDTRVFCTLFVILYENWRIGMILSMLLRFLLITQKISFRLRRDGKYAFAKNGTTDFSRKGTIVISPVRSSVCPSVRTNAG